MLDWMTLVQLGIFAAQGIIQVATKNKLPQNIIDAANNALAELKKVQGTEVTREQLESLRTSPQW